MVPSDNSLPERVLQTYVDSLFEEELQETAVAPATGLRTLPSVLTEEDEARLKSGLVDAPSLDVDDVVPPVSQEIQELDASTAIVEPAIEPEAAHEVVAAVEPEQVTEAGLKRDRPRPAWSERPFEALLFKVGGLTLAVPLIDLGNIQALEADDITPLFGQADWLLGLAPGLNGNLRLVDTAKVVMPERYQDSMLDKYGYTVSIEGFDWALAIDEVDKSVTLSPDAIKWRTARAQRPWLAGTVKEHMCALLDASVLGEMFMLADKNRKVDK